MAQLIANRYASALFEAGEDLDKVDLFYDELKSLREIFVEEKELSLILGHPKISKKEKKELIDKLFKGKISQEIINFIYILIDKNRQQNLMPVMNMFEDLYYDYKGVLRVVAVTAMPMKKESEERLSGVLADKLNKEIEISNEVRDDIIGGIRLELEGKLVDGTIKGKLASMARTFRAATN